MGRRLLYIALLSSSIWWRLALGALAVESTCPVECVTGVRVSRYHTWHSHVFTWKKIIVGPYESVVPGQLIYSV